MTESKKAKPSALERAGRRPVALFLLALIGGGALLVAGGLDWIPLADRSIPSRIATATAGVVMICLGIWFAFRYFVDIFHITSRKGRSERGDEGR